MRRAKIEEQNRHQLDRQRQFRMAADLVADAWSRFAEVRAIAVIGSVAAPLWKEVPRFSEFRRERIAVWHETGDLDLALWLDSQHRLGQLRKAAGLTLQKGQQSGLAMGVANHHLDVFLIEPLTDRYVGQLCIFSQCPKGKPACFVPGCGDIAFNRKFPDFTPRADLVAGAEATMLYRRGVGRLRSALDLPGVDDISAP